MASLGKGILMNITKTIEPVWNCIEAARFLTLHPKTVKRMARLGQIPADSAGAGFSVPRIWTPFCEVV